MVVPERINLAQDLLNKENVPWIELDNGYKIYTKLVSYKNVEQRLKLVYSQQAFDKEVETLNKNIAKEHKELTNLLKYNEYSCQKDAIKEVNNINKNLKFHTLEYDIIIEYQYDRKGRPNKNETPKGQSFKLVHQ